MEKINLENEKQKQEELKIKLQEQALKEEIKLERQRTKDIKIFLKKGTSIIKNRTSRKTKTIFKTIKIRKTN